MAGLFFFPKSEASAGTKTQGDTESGAEDAAPHARTRVRPRRPQFSSDLPTFAAGAALLAVHGCLRGQSDADEACLGV